MSLKFTKKNTLMEIVEQSGKAMCLFFSDSLLSLIPEKYRNIPLEEWADGFKMPWGLPFPADELLEDAEMSEDPDRYWDMIPLWVKEGYTIDSNDIHSVGIMIPKNTITGIRPAVLICPGGGYENVAFHTEGLDTAKALEKAGYRTFILNYRFSPNRYPAPQLDLVLAIKHLRANAAEYQIDPDNLMILGYSAGGHLCASTAAYIDELEKTLQKELEANRPDLSETYRGISGKPDKVCLCYPVISFLKEAHESSFQMLTGGEESLREKLSIEKHVGPGYPKTFVWTCADDSFVPPSNARRMAEALRENNVPYLLKVYPQGEHGCNLGIGTSAEGWMDEMRQFMEGKGGK